MKSSKNNIVTLKIIIGLLLITMYGTAKAQSQQGFINRLIEIKYSSELYLTNAIKKGSTPNAMDTALANYNTIRWQVDGLVYQLSSTMILQNSPAILRQLDAWSYGQNESRAIKNYISQLKAIEKIYQENIEPKIYPGNTRTLNLTTNVFYLLKDSYTIVKGLSDLKTRKVMALVELLDHTRLMGPGELMKMGK